MDRPWGATLRRAATALLALVLGACAMPTEFTTPIEDPGSRRIDPRLLGTWYGVSRCRFVSPNDFGPTCYIAGNRPALLIILHITPENDATALTIRQTAIALDLADLYDDDRRRGAGRVIQFEAVAHPALLDGVGYYSLRRRAGFGYDYTGYGEQPHYIVAQLEVDQHDSLHYRLLSHGYLSQVEFKAQGLRHAAVSADDKQVLGYAIAEFDRGRLSAFLRERHYPTIDGYTVGPFQRMTRDLSMASPDTRACAPDRDRRYGRFAALAELSLDLATQGLPREARESATLALAVDRAGLREEVATLNLATITEALGRSDDLEGAKVALKRITDYQATRSPTADANEATRLAERVVTATAWSGNFADATRLAQALPEESLAPRAWAFSVIAAAQVQQGDWSGAIHSARRTGTVGSLLVVEKELARRGDHARARATLMEAAALASGSVRELVSVAEVQLQRGLREDATLTGQVAMAVLGERRSDPLVMERIGLAKLQIELGDRQSARQTLAPISGMIEEGRIKVSDFYLEAAKLVALQFHLGDQPVARDVLQRLLTYLRERETRLDPQRLSNEYDRYQLNEAMVQGYAAVGALEEAISLAQTLSRGQRVRALYSIVEIQQYVDRNPSRSRETLRLAHDSAKALRESDPDAWEVSPNGIAKIAGIHNRAGDRNRAISLYGDAEEIATRAPLRRYQGTDGVRKRVSDLRWIADYQQNEGFAADAKATSLRALEMARSMPDLSPCDSDELLRLLSLPEIERVAR